MLEKDFNSILQKNFNINYFAYKIPDPPQSVATTSAKRPFDLFAVTNFSIFFIESKFLKGYQSFNFRRIDDHQFDALLKIYDNTVALRRFVKPLICLGIWESRKFLHFMLFDIKYIYDLKESGKKSFLKKELLEFKEQGLFVDIKKKEFEVTKENIVRKIINGREKRDY